MINVCSPHHNHVFVELVGMSRRARCLAGPESHLARVRSLKHVALHARNRLAAGSDPVDRLLHELRKFLHDENTTAQKWTGEGVRRSFDSPVSIRASV